MFRRVLDYYLPELSSSNSDITSITVVHVQLLVIGWVGFTLFTGHEGP
jgi:hypothetical protein